MKDRYIHIYSFDSEENQRKGFDIFRHLSDYIIDGVVFFCYNSQYWKNDFSALDDR